MEFTILLLAITAVYGAVLRSADLDDDNRISIDDENLNIVVKTPHHHHTPCSKKHHGHCKPQSQSSASSNSAGAWFTNKYPSNNGGTGGGVNSGSNSGSNSGGNNVGGSGSWRPGKPSNNLPSGLSGESTSYGSGNGSLSLNELIHGYSQGPEYTGQGGNSSPSSKPNENQSGQSSGNSNSGNSNNSSASGGSNTNNNVLNNVSNSVTGGDVVVNVNVINHVHNNPEKDKIQNVNSNNKPSNSSDSNKSPNSEDNVLGNGPTGPIGNNNNNTSVIMVGPNSLLITLPIESISLDLINAILNSSGSINVPNENSENNNNQPTNSTEPKENNMPSNDCDKLLNANLGLNVADLISSILTGSSGSGSPLNLTLCLLDLVKVNATVDSGDKPCSGSGNNNMPTEPPMSGDKPGSGDKPSSGSGNNNMPTEPPMSGDKPGSGDKPSSGSDDCDKLLNANLGLNVAGLISSILTGSSGSGSPLNLTLCLLDLVKVNATVDSGDKPSSGSGNNNMPTEPPMSGNTPGSGDKPSSGSGNNNMPTEPPMSGNTPGSGDKPSSGSGNNNMPTEPPMSGNTPGSGDKPCSGSGNNNMPTEPPMSGDKPDSGDKPSSGSGNNNMPTEPPMSGDKPGSGDKPSSGSGNNNMPTEPPMAGNNPGSGVKPSTGSDHCDKLLNANLGLNVEGLISSILNGSSGSGSPLNLTLCLLDLVKVNATVDSGDKPSSGSGNNNMPTEPPMSGDKPGSGDKPSSGSGNNNMPTEPPMSGNTPGSGDKPCSGSSNNNMPTEPPMSGDKPGSGDKPSSGSGNNNMPTEPPMSGDKPGSGDKPSSGSGNNNMPTEPPMSGDKPGSGDKPSSGSDDCDKLLNANLGLNVAGLISSILTGSSGSGSPLNLTLCLLDLVKVNATVDSGDKPSSESGNNNMPTEPPMSGDKPGSGDEPSSGSGNNNMPTEPPMSGNTPGSGDKPCSGSGNNNMPTEPPMSGDKPGSGDKPSSGSGNNNMPTEPPMSGDKPGSGDKPSSGSDDCDKLLNANLGLNVAGLISSILTGSSGSGSPLNLTLCLLDLVKVNVTVDSGDKPSSGSGNNNMPTEPPMSGDKPGSGDKPSSGSDDCDKLLNANLGLNVAGLISSILTGSSGSGSPLNLTLCLLDLVKVNATVDSGDKPSSGSGNNNMPTEPPMSGDKPGSGDKPSSGSGNNNMPTEPPMSGDKPGSGDKPSSGSDDCDKLLNANLGLNVAGLISSILTGSSGSGSPLNLTLCLLDLVKVNATVDSGDKPSSGSGNNNMPTEPPISGDKPGSGDKPSSGSGNNNMPTEPPMSGDKPGSGDKPSSGSGNNNMPTEPPMSGDKPGSGDKPSSGSDDCDKLLNANLGLNVAGLISSILTGSSGSGSPLNLTLCLLDLVKVNATVDSGDKPSSGSANNNMPTEPPMSGDKPGSGDKPSSGSDDCDKLLNANLGLNVAGLISSILTGSSGSGSPLNLTLCLLDLVKVNATVDSGDKPSSGSGNNNMPTEPPISGDKPGSGDKPSSGSGNNNMPTEPPMSGDKPGSGDKPSSGSGNNNMPTEPPMSGDKPGSGDKPSSGSGNNNMPTEPPMSGDKPGSGDKPSSGSDDCDKLLNANLGLNVGDLLSSILSGGSRSLPPLNISLCLLNLVKVNATVNNVGKSISNIGVSGKPIGSAELSDDGPSSDYTSSADGVLSDGSDKNIRPTHKRLLSGRIPKFGRGNRKTKKGIKKTNVD